MNFQQTLVWPILAERKRRANEQNRRWYGPAFLTESNQSQTYKQNRFKDPGFEMTHENNPCAVGNRIASHASKQVEASQYRSDGNGGIARLAFAHAEDKGIDIEPILKSSSLSRNQMSDPLKRLEVRHQIKFVEVVAETVADDFLGFHLSRDYDLRLMGLLYYVIASSDRLDKALLRCARYSSVANEGIKLTFRKTKQHIGVVFEYVGVARRLERHQIEVLIASVIRVCRQITNRNLTAAHVSFSHWRRVSPELNKFFGCDVKFGASVDEALFPSSIQDIPVTSCDPYLDRILTQYYEEALAHRKVRQSSFAVSVENAISRLMPHGKAQLSEVARELGIGRRTLARRLSSEGSTFVDVLRNLRCDLAKRHLADEHLSVSKIAWLLGYQDISAFTNAFRRRTGRPPGAVRKGLQ